jgi:hypothetical protein
MLARLESPRRPLATLGPRPGGFARIDGGSSRRSTVMRPYPSGQPAHIRVIRRRSRRVTALPLRCLRILWTLAPLPAERGARPPVGRRAFGGQIRHREGEVG